MTAVVLLVAAWAQRRGGGAKRLRHHQVGIVRARSNTVVENQGKRAPFDKCGEEESGREEGGA